MMLPTFNVNLLTSAEPQRREWSLTASYEDVPKSMSDMDEKRCQVGGIQRKRGSVQGSRGGPWPLDSKHAPLRLPQTQCREEWGQRVALRRSSRTKCRTLNLEARDFRPELPYLLSPAHIKTGHFPTQSVLKSFNRRSLDWGVSTHSKIRLAMYTYVQFSITFSEGVHSRAVSCLQPGLVHLRVNHKDSSLKSKHLYNFHIC